MTLYEAIDALSELQSESAGIVVEALRAIDNYSHDPSLLERKLEGALKGEKVNPQ